MLCSRHGVRVPWRLSRLAVRPIRHASHLNHPSAFSELRDVIDGQAAAGREPLAAPTGLFGQPGLRTPADIVRIAQNTQRQAGALVRRIEEANDGQTAEVVRNLDRLSDMLCQVIDMAEFVRTAHASDDWRLAAQHAHQLLCTYMNVLNTNQRLYKTLSNVVRNGTAQLSEEGVRVAQAFLHDFESSAIHLPQAERERFVALSDDSLALSTAFQNNLEDDAGRPPARLRREWLSDLPEAVREALPSGALIELPAGSPLLPQVLRHCADMRARVIAYRAAHAGGPRQKRILETLLERRAQLASLAGYDSYAHMVLRDKMARAPDDVTRFLQGRLQRARSAVHAEARTLSAQPLQAWDREYLTHRHTSRWSPAVAPIQHFFSVGTVFAGLSQIWARLFGMHLQVSRAAPGETWSDDVLKLEVIDEDAGGRVGVIYADLWSRAGKPHGAAHFTIRCSRRLDCDDRGIDSSLDTHAARTRDREGLYQQPIVALLCDFRRPSGDSLSFMQWHEIETLFHEMGHALHSMVGRTEYQNVSGTRCATDFVEIPSILMERFLRDARVLPLFARHYATGKALPWESLELHLRAQRTFQHLEEHDELLLALLDQRLHQRRADDGAFNSTSVFERAQEEAGLLPPVYGLDWPARFSHLVSYPASYYAYPLDRTVAAALWERLFAADPLSRDAGDAYKRRLLAAGGGHDAHALVQRLLPDWSLR